MTITMFLVLVLMIFAVGPWWTHASGWGYGPSGFLFSILIVLLILKVLEII